MNNYQTDNTAWTGLYAMHEDTLRDYAVSGIHPQAIKASVPAQATPSAKPYGVMDTAAIVPILGPIAKYGIDREGKPTGKSALQVQTAINAAMNDNAIESVVLFIDSPGGTVAGTSDLASYIAQAKSIKPIVAYVSDHCMSAAYWIASQCTRIVANEGAFIGSIGVLQVITDTSLAAEKAGVQIRLVKAGEYKGIGTPGLSVDDKAIEEFQRGANAAYDLFTKSIAQGRNLPIDVVKQLADGRIHIAAEAKALKLIDDIGTIEVAMSVPLKGATNMEDDKKVEGSAPAEAPNNDDVLKSLVDMVKQLIQKVDELTQDEESEDSADDSGDETAKADDDTADDTEAKAAKAVAQDRERLKAIHDACGGRAEFAMQAFLAGKSPVEAKASLADILAAENTDLRKKVASGGDGVEPLALGKSDSADYSDPEAVWAKNVGDVQTKFSGKKEYYLAAHKYEKAIKEKH